MYMWHVTSLLLLFVCCEIEGQIWGIWAKYAVVEELFRQLVKTRKRFSVEDSRACAKASSTNVSTSYTSMPLPYWPLRCKLYTVGTSIFRSKCMARILQREDVQAMLQWSARTVPVILNAWTICFLLHSSVPDIKPLSTYCFGKTAVRFLSEIVTVTASMDIAPLLLIWFAILLRSFHVRLAFLIEPTFIFLYYDSFLFLSNTH